MCSILLSSYGAETRPRSVPKLSPPELMLHDPVMSPAPILWWADTNHPEYARTHEYASTSVPGELYFYRIYGVAGLEMTMHIYYTDDYFQTWTEHIHVIGDTGATLPPLQQHTPIRSWLHLK